jgi:hypothetical protein
MQSVPGSRGEEDGSSSVLKKRLRVSWPALALSGIVSSSAEPAKASASRAIGARLDAHEAK